MNVVGSKKLNYYWRVLATGFCFLTFSIGGLFLALIVLPVARISTQRKKTKTRRARKVVHHTMRLFLWLMQFSGCLSVDVKNVGLLRHSRGQLVIANHPSLIDVIILIAHIPHCCCVVKNELWRNPFLGGVMRGTGYISNSNPAQLLERCKSAFDEGYSIIVFPEGTRTSEEKPMIFRRGAANIAFRCNADILPASIIVDPPTLKKGDPWYRVPVVRKSHFNVRVFEEIKIADIVEPQTDPATATRLLTTYLQDYYLDILKHA